MAATDELGDGAPLAPREVAALLADAPLPWAFAGGHALELALGRSWRTHDDVDVAIVRTDAVALHRHLAPSHELHVAAAGTLTRWHGRPLVEAAHENNVWARAWPGGPWLLDVVVGGGDERHWWSRRDPSIRLPWDQAVAHAGGLPYLAPEVQLLMKSKDVRPKDDVDAREVVPELSVDARRRLATWLAPSHPWQRLLAGP